MQKLIKKIIDVSDFEIGKTLKELKTIKVGQVWGREDDFWIITHVDEKTVKFFGGQGAGTDSTRLTQERSQSYESLKKYFLMEPRERTYNTIVDDRLINHLFFKKEILEEVDIVSDLKQIIDNIDEDYLKKLNNLKEAIKNEKTTVTELMCKEVFTNGINKIFLSFWNVNKIYELSELMVLDGFFERFNYPTIESKIYKHKDSLTKDINNFLDTGILIKSLDTNDRIFKEQITDTHTILLVPSEEKIMIPKKVIQEPNFYKKHLVYHKIKSLKKLYIISLLVVNKYIHL